MKLSTCIRQFFGRYLPRIRNMSDQTIGSYRDAIKIFLSFAAGYHSIKIESLRVDHMTFDMVLSFLDHLEDQRGNSTGSRNHRLAVIKALAHMILLLHPEHRNTAERILCIPQKRAQKNLVEYLHHEEIVKVFESVDFKRKEGFRDYTILNLLYDTGARASEIGTLKLDYFDPGNKTLSILGKGNRFRRVELWPRTVILIKRYTKDSRNKPRPTYMDRLFINQRGEALTRHGVYCICRKHLRKALSSKRLQNVNPAHSFRHSCAIHMLNTGYSITDIKNQLGHENINSTMVYLKMNIVRKREVQEEFIEHSRSLFTRDVELDELLDWDNKDALLTWLDSL